MRARVKYGVYSAVSVVMALAILVFVLMISHQNHHRFDITAEQRFSLSPQSVKVLDGLKEPVQAIAFVKDKDLGNRTVCDDLLSMYQARNAKMFSYKIVDPVLQPLEAKKYNIRMPGSIVVVCGNRNGLATTPSEQDLTNALVSLSKTVDKKVYFTVGHGEWQEAQADQQGGTSISQMRKSLASEGFIGADLSLAATGRVPEDAVAVIIAGPKTGFLPKEQKVFSEWMAAGGKAFVMLDLESGANYDWLLKPYAMESPNEIIIDINSQMAGATPIFVVCNKYDEQSSMTENFRLDTCFKVARPVLPLEQKPKNATVKGLAFSQENTFSVSEETLTSSGGAISPANASHQGAMPLLAYGVYPLSDKPNVAKDANGEVRSRQETRLVVAGDVEFAGDELYGVGGNRDLTLNILNWLAGSDEHITIRAKTSGVEPIMVAGKTMTVIKVLLIVAVPLLVFLTGVSCARRRKH